MNWELNVKKGDRQYYIRSNDFVDRKNNIWEFYISNEHDEGMSMSAINLFELLDVFFKENF